MPFNVLLLPLLGGYLFLTHWNYTRFNTKRHSGERLIFHSAAAGVFLLILSFLVVQLIIDDRPDLYSAWRERVPFAYTGTSFGAFLLGAFAWWPLNKLFFPLAVAQRRVIAEWGDYLEELLERALRETYQVALTTRNGKVYVGLVLTNVDPAYDRRYIRLLPLSSGYRDKDTQTVNFTTDYSRVYAEMLESESLLDDERASEFEIVLPVSEIVSANLFNPDAYVRFEQPDAEDES
jgi:hypothetical protein